MKIITTEFGQVFQKIIMEEVRPLYPHSALVPADFFKETIDRYQFTGPSTDPAEIAKGVIKFGNGKITLDGRDVPIGELGIFPDGIIIVTRDTRHSEAVLEDFTKWAITKYSLREPETKFARRFGSHIVVEFETSIDSAISLYERFSHRYSQTIQKLYETNVPINLSRLTFGTDPELMKPHTDTNFLIERRVSVSWKTNRWFCSAPLPTDIHIEHLEFFEELASR